MVACATRAISAMFSGGTGSSNHRGSYGSMRLARRMAEAVVHWPWVPNSKSTPLPTVSRSARVTASALSSVATESSRGSNADIGMIGSYLTAVKPRET